MLASPSESRLKPADVLCRRTGLRHTLPSVMVRTSFGSPALVEGENQRRRASGTSRRSNEKNIVLPSK